MRPYSIASGVLLVAIALGLSSCGGSGAAKLPPPAEGTPIAAWAKDAKLSESSDKASFSARFVEIGGAVMAAQEIYMALHDPYDRVVFNTTAKTDEKGIAQFKNVPVGNYMLLFVDPAGRGAPWVTDLGAYSGENAGKSLGDFNF